MKSILRFLIVSLFLLAPAAVFAQRAPASPAAANVPSSAPATAAPSAASAPGATPASTGSLSVEEMNKPFTGSFFLSPLEIAAIQQALVGKVASSKMLAEESKPIPAHRVIRISGVLYRTPQDWVVWMNNQKVTPDNLLPEIIDISVRDSSKVHLRWYDIGLNQVIAITLRPHQTYDITTGILLPGTQ